MHQFAIALAAAGMLLAPVPDEELSAAAKKASEMTSYSFKITASGGRAKGKAAGGTVEGKYEKDQPVSLKSAGAEGFRQGGALVTKEGEEWKRYERLKGAQAKAAGTKPRTAPGEALTAVKLPHEDLSEIDKALKEPKKAEAKENDCSVWSGELTETAARTFGNPGTKGGGDLAYTGTAKLWINAQGAIVKYEITTQGKGKVKDRDVEQTSTRTVEIADVGSAKVEVPEAAKKALEGKT